MADFKLRTTFSLLTIILLALVAPVLAVDYNVGVSKGQYVRYGNFVGIGPGVESFNDYDWQKLEVINVSGKEVTLLSTGQLKNGAPTPGNGTIQVWNIETGTENGNASVQGPLIAANLNEGDPIPPPDTYVVNRTETHQYLGTSRSINILNSTIITPDYTTVLTFFYDRASGMLLEATSETNQTQPQPTTSKYSYSVIETNIFTSQTTPTIQPTTSPTLSPPTSPQPPSTGIPTEPIIVTAVIVTAIIVIVAIIALKKKTK